MRAVLGVCLRRCLLAACVVLPLWHADARGEESWAPPVVDDALNSFLLFDLLEYQGDANVDRARWDAVGWLGGDVNRLWFKTEGGYEASGGDAEFQLLYGRLVAPFWDLQAGVRYDRSFGPGADRGRAFGIVGVQGLAPYWFELEPWVAVSEDGDVSARLTASYDLLLTQRLVLQPRLETEVAIQEVERFGVGRGFNYVEPGLRLRYEIRRQFAPYVGINWNRLLGQTADLADDAGGTSDELTVVVGVRVWF